MLFRIVLTNSFGEKIEDYLVTKSQENANQEARKRAIFQMGKTLNHTWVGQAIEVPEVVKNWMTR